MLRPFARQPLCHNAATLRCRLLSVRTLCSSSSNVRPSAAPTSAGPSSAGIRPPPGSVQVNPSSGREAPTFAETLSKWLWRGLLTASGAGLAGAGAVYVTDPAGTREVARAAMNDIDERIKFFTEPSREELLPDPVPPFPGSMPLRTLVIELDTLVHSSYNRQFGWRVAKRPGADAFLAYMSTFYEIVVFTSGLNSYADPILNQMDPNKYYVAYRLYRAETKYEGGVHVKDLSHLNRDLSRVILVDDDAKHFKYQPENAILLPKWSDDPTDTALLDLVPFLEGLVHEDVTDVRSDVATLHGKALSDGLAEHRALALTRPGRTATGRGGLFGASSAPTAGSGQSPAASGNDAASETSGKAESSAGEDGSGSSLWGQMSSKSLFRPSRNQQTTAEGSGDEA
jgi:Dullard-like phosphatase family protein